MRFKRTPAEDLIALPKGLTPVIEDIAAASAPIRTVDAGGNDTAAQG